MRGLLLVLALAAVAADRPSATGGKVYAVAGAAPGRGQPRPAGPRADVFVQGLPGDERPLAERVRTPFRRSSLTAVPDTLEVVFFANSRPVRALVTVRLGGRPLGEAWEAHLKKLFAGFDRDRSGDLNRFEVEHIFSSRGVTGLLAGTYFYRTPAGAQSFEELDRDGDGRVSFDEFAAYYQDAAADMVRPRFVPTQNDNDARLTRDLFALLDQNKDGKLSRDEVRRAEAVLLALDSDEDECLSAFELQASRPPEPVATAAAMPAAPTTKRPRDTTPEPLHVFRGPVPEAVADQFVNRYGQRPAAELEAWRTGPPDAVVVLDLGADPKHCRAEVKPGRGKTWPDGIELRPAESGRAVLKVGTQFLDLSAVALPPDAAAARQNQMVAAAFPPGKQVVTEEDIGGPQYQFLRIVFESADFDADGKLTRAEFDRYLALQQETIDLALAMTYSVRTPSLFQLMDENGDGRLGIRELRTAWDRLIVLEPGGGPDVTAAALQPSAAVRLGRAATISADPFVFRGPFGRTAKGGPAAPLWFQKMDRNGDGDVSRLEFLGSRADFDRIDANRDGLIAVEEAVAFDKAARK